MRPAAKILLSLTLFLGAVFLSIKGYSHYRVIGFLDRAVVSVQPYADIEYLGVQTSLTGDVTVEEIRVTPADFGDTLEIESARLRLPGRLGLLNLIGGSEEAVILPRRLRLSFTALRLPLQGDLAAALYQVLQGSGAAGVGQGDACAPFALPGPEDYRVLGLTEWVLDATLDYALDEAVPELEIDIDYRLRELQSGSMALTLTGALHPAALMLGRLPLLKSLEITVTPHPLFDLKLTAYCAARKQTTTTQYRQWLAAAFAGGAGWAEGLGPGPCVRRAMLDYLKNPAPWRVRLNPERPMDVTALRRHEPADREAMLGLQIELAGRRIRGPDCTPPGEGDGPGTLRQGPRGGADAAGQGPMQGLAPGELRFDRQPPR